MKIINITDTQKALEQVISEYIKAIKRIPRATSIVGIIIVIASCGASQTTQNNNTKENNRNADDLHIVDCLLPGQIHRLGNMTYVSERKATKTTAIECNIRGGDYVAYDRANYRTALNVWLKNAEKGDAEAQTYVGEIFEKGLGNETDYVTAAKWYEKAAKQGYKRAQINLGFLYEKGLGVEQDITKALNYYRLSADGEEVVFAAEAQKEVEKVRNELKSKLGTSLKESDYLKTQLASMKAQSERLQKNQVEPTTEKVKSLEYANNQIEVLQNLYQKSTQELEKLNQKLTSLPKATYRNIPQSELLGPLNLKKTDTLKFKNINFGRYFALIIGNQDYMYLDDLQSPKKDALRLQSILEKKYGFSTVTLFDANEKEILNAFNDLYKQIGAEDNLLVFYAGHGNLRLSSNSRRKIGYWLPTNAESDVLTNWISNSVISDHLDRIKARSILVIADSCFAGNLASEKSSFLLGGMNTHLSKKSINLGLSRRSRIVISSGGEAPVLDGMGEQHSIFANSLIHLLESNKGILRDNMVFSRVAVNVRQQAKVKEIEQTPEMRPIRAAGHEGGDFYFVPQNLSADASKELPSNLLTASN